MYKYALVSAYKDRYDRPINIELVAIFDMVGNASLYLKENCIKKEDKNIKEAIEKNIHGFVEKMTNIIIYNI